ncbi:heterogeneous nuclear ribonucleoprotein L [Pelomyxa schiedti]|nr:heterogeneous nuclear ribonucleoprotein L [Pelomyxa schiedti]
MAANPAAVKSALVGNSRTLSPATVNTMSPDPQPTSAPSPTSGLSTTPSASQPTRADVGNSGAKTGATAAPRSRASPPVTTSPTVIQQQQQQEPKQTQQQQQQPSIGVPQSTSPTATLASSGGPVTVSTQGSMAPLLPDPVPTMSKVVHVRNVLESMNEQLVAFASQFGNVVAYVHLAKFNQALIEMANISAASALVTATRERPVYINDTELQFSYSKSQKINQQSMKRSPQQPNRVLLVSIINPLYAITVDVLYAIMSPYGAVQRIVIFSKNGVQALVEFDTSQSASIAKSALEGKDIYSGACTLKIEFSHTEKLNVTANTDTTRDFTNPGLPTGPLPGQVLQPTMQSMREQYPGMGMSSLVGYVDPSVAVAQVQAAAMDFYRSVGVETHSVLMVYNVDDKAFTPDRLFNLFCLYGNVLKIKCLGTKKGVAMVQMGDGMMAETAKNFLNGATLFSQQLQIVFSRHPYILDSRASPTDELSAELQPTTMCKDFSSSPLNRCKSSSSLRHVYRPSHSLYFNNIPNDFTEENMLAVFQNLHAPLPTTVKFFTKREPLTPGKEDRNTREGLIEFMDAPTATNALCIANNIKVTPLITLRLAFSKPPTLNSSPAYTQTVLHS